MKLSTERTDTEIQNDVILELNYEPSVTVTDIGVLVREGIVTLNGYARSYGEKWDAVRATKRVAGVRAIADDIEVRLVEGIVKTDGDIAASAVERLNSSSAVQPSKIQITVRQGWITLEGSLEWWYQKDAAESSIRYLPGVRGVNNLIQIAPSVPATDIQSTIHSAIHRNALLDAENIHVEIKGNAVTLTGNVRNYPEREEAERVAWAAPGVFNVDNQLKVDWYWGIAD